MMVAPSQREPRNGVSVVLRDRRILNSRLLEVLTRAGHTDAIVIADSGLPIPRNVELVDLSVCCGLPSMLDVLACVRVALVIESAAVAHEMREQPVYEQFIAEMNGTPTEELSHEEFKRRTTSALAIVRTGECTPYANVLLIAGVSF